jgi:hypothetical protein
MREPKLSDILDFVQRPAHEHALLTKLASRWFAHGGRKSMFDVGIMEGRVTEYSAESRYQQETQEYFDEGMALLKGKRLFWGELTRQNNEG